MLISATGFLAMWKLRSGPRGQRQETGRFPCTRTADDEGPTGTADAAGLPT